VIPAKIIAAKRDSAELSDAEIAYFVQGFAEDKIPDYQMSALAMAIYLNGMSDRETATLTQQMLDSGTRLSWPDEGAPCVDKHSTGGVGDKVSIPLAPLLACCGLHVPMLSGRGLGATGGTLDKLESIPGFRTNLSLAEIHSLTKQVGCVITGASAELAPADRRLYALRDVTATVPSIPLITASIMSKKLAESLDALVLDVKFGSGAFMKTRERATELAQSHVRTGQRMGVHTTALLTDMNQPLGHMCGNANEILESIDILKGDGPDDVRELTLALAAELLVSTGIETDSTAAVRLAQQRLDDGSAYEKYQQMIVAQGGNPDAVLKLAVTHDVLAAQAGVVSAIDTEQLGTAVIVMGGGRRSMSDVIDPSVGIRMCVRLGDRVNQGQLLAQMFTHQPDQPALLVRQAIVISKSGMVANLIVGRITS